MVEICTDINSVRLRYAAEQLFAPVPVRWCQHKADLNHPEKAIFYATSETGFFVVPTSPRNWTDATFEYSAQPQDWNSRAIQAPLDLDVFELTFYLLARVDEYLNPQSDDHGRVIPDGFIQQKWMGLDVAYLDEIRKQWLRHIGVEDVLVPQCALTIDVDSAYAFSHKGWKRALGGLGKDLLHFNLTNLQERLATWVGMKRDRFDTYDYLMDQSKTHQWDLTFFFLLSDFEGQNIGLPHHSMGLRLLIQRVQEAASVGIHPGYHNWNEDAERTALEIQRLKDILGGKVQLSRQHFLRMRLPETYRLLSSLGIQQDFSMGMATDVGYRAGTSRPFLWFDYPQNTISALTVVPFWGMDSAIKRHKEWSPEEAKNRISLARQYIAEIGDWRMIWHNETVCDEREWAGWRAVFEQQFKSI